MAPHLHVSAPHGTAVTPHRGIKYSVAQCEFLPVEQIKSRRSVHTLLDTRDGLTHIDHMIIMAAPGRIAPRCEGTQ